MASDLNRVVLIGRLTRDPELRHTADGTAVASFSLANGKTYVKNNEKREQTSFFNCVAWGKLGDVVAQWAKKGHRIGIEGRLQQRTWDDKDGNRRQSVEIVIENLQFLQPKSDGNKGSQGAADPGPAPEGNPLESGTETGSAPPVTPFSDDDLPF